MSIIYGVDTSEEVTPELVKEAIVVCFFEAHCEQSELNSSGDIESSYCSELVKKAFTETGGDFHNPTKQSIIACIPWLVEFSKNFRDQTVIQKHMSQIMELIGLMKE
jgi:hypothetical protein